MHIANTYKQQKANKAKIKYIRLHFKREYHAKKKNYQHNQKHCPRKFTIIATIKSETTHKTIKSQKTAMTNTFEKSFSSEPAANCGRHKSSIQKSFQGSTMTAFWPEVKAKIRDFGTKITRDQRSRLPPPSGAFEVRERTEIFASQISYWALRCAKSMKKSSNRPKWKSSKCAGR